VTQDLVRVGGALLNSKQMKENPLSFYAEKKAKSLGKAMDFEGGNDI